MIKILEKFGDYYLNPNQIVEMVFEDDKTIIHLSNSTSHEFTGAIAAVLKADYQPKPYDASEESGSYEIGGSYVIK